MSKKTLEQQVNNSKKDIENKRKMYNSEIEFGWIHGFQKDAIQNSSGARINYNFDNWNFELKFHKFKDQDFLIVIDSGTHGLTGPNFDRNQLENYQKETENIPENYRLARFSSANNSGGVSNSAGLYGVGKSVYAMASFDYKYYFDSLSVDGYRSNIYDAGELFYPAKEGEEAKDFIFSSTGLNPLEKTGTRIIICNPRTELVETINDKTLKSYIEETWWRSVLMYPPSAFININGEIISYPKFLDKDNIIHFYDIDKPFIADNGYQVKRIGLYVLKECKEHEKGFYFYRKGMRIGKINIQNIPKELKNDFVGYIEVDESWEMELSLIENATHYDVEMGGKHRREYSILRNVVNEFFIEQMNEWGFIKKEETQDLILNKQLNQIKRKLEDLFANLGFDDLGVGEQKQKILFRLIKIEYPETGSKSIFNKNIINCRFLIRNQFKNHVNMEFSSSIINYYGNETLLHNEMITMKGESKYEGFLTITINDINSTPYERNQVSLKLTPTRGNSIKKSFEFYYKKDTPEPSWRDFSLVINNMNLPRKNSKRINTDESIQNISYSIKNNTAADVDLVLSVSTHNIESNGNEIEKIDRIYFTAESGSENIISIRDIVFSKTTYENHLLKGVLEIRARLISNCNIGDIEKGDRLTHYDYKVYFNRNEKKGIEDSFDIQYKKLPDDFRRSWVEGYGQQKVIYFNIAHPAYVITKEQGNTEEYFFEQMLKQFVNLYVREGNYSVLSIDRREYEYLDPYQKHEKINDCIENLLFISLKGGS